MVVTATDTGDHGALLDLAGHVARRATTMPELPMERAYKIKMMQRALKDAGLDRSAASYALFDRGTRREPLLGKVVGVGFVDEITDRHYVVIDGADARVQYVELGRLNPDNVPSRDNFVRITGDRLDGKPQSTPRLQILSRDSLQGMAHYDGPVWLDRLAHTADPGLQSTRGFGAQLNQAVAQRRQWLVSQDLARFRDDGGFELRTSAYARLRAREMQRVGLEAAARLRASFHAVAAGERVQGRVGETIQASGGKIVIIERRDGVSAVPWSRGLENLRGCEISGIVGSRGLVMGRMRGLQR